MIHLARDGRQLGEFTLDEVQEGLRSGRFLPTDSQFTEGMDGWLPLGQWSAPTARRKWGLGALFGCGALSLSLGALALVAVGGIAFWLLPEKPSEPFPQTLALFRIGMLHDWRATVHRYGDEQIQRQFADWTVAMWDPVAPDVAWSWWFGTAVFTAVELDGAQPRTAFYNPWSDTFWLAEWDLRREPRITKSWFGAGDVLRSRGKPPWNETPLWLRGRGSRAEALAGALRLSIPAAEVILTQRDWPDPTKPEAGDANASLCRTALVSVLADLVTLERPQEKEAAPVTRLREGLGALRRLEPATLAQALREAPDNSEASRTALAALPAPLGATMRPVCWLGAGGTALVILMPTQSADVALGTVWDTSARRARLLRVDVLPFAEMLRAAREGRRP